jgi:lysophospholipase L1-like esterase
MRRGTLLILIFLSLLLIASLSANVFIARRAKSFYVQLNAVRLDPLGLQGYPPAKEPLPRPNVVFFGDSRAEQWVPPAGLSKVRVVNRGIGNQTTTQVLGRFSEQVAPLKPEVLVLQVGVNDLKTIPLFPAQKAEIVRTCKGNIAQLVKAGTDSGARVIVTTIFPLGKVPLERKPFWSDDVAAAIVEVNTFIKTLAGESVTVFDATPVLANAEGIVDAKYSRDLLHLRPEGYAALNHAMRDLLAPK